MLMNSTPEENASKYRVFLLKWGIKTLRKKYWRFWMQSAPQLTDLVEDRHRMPYKGSPKKIILKLSRRKDSRLVLLNKEKLKQLKPESLSLPAHVKTYINESLCPYYKKLWIKCTKLWDAKRILSFWVSNGSIRVKLVNENNSIITRL